jgi:hypothetical protein
MDLEYILNNSLCKHCDHRVTRVVSTEGLEVEFYDDLTVTSSAPETEDDDFSSFTHEYCTKLCIELDHIVLDCSKFNLIEL